MRFTSRFSLKLAIFISGPFFLVSGIALALDPEAMEMGRRSPNRTPQGRYREKERIEAAASALYALEEHKRSYEEFQKRKSLAREAAKKYLPWLEIQIRNLDSETQAQWNQAVQEWADTVRAEVKDLQEPWRTFRVQLYVARLHPTFDKLVLPPLAGIEGRPNPEYLYATFQAYVEKRFQQITSPEKVGEPHAKATTSADTDPSTHSTIER